MLAEEESYFQKNEIVSSIKKGTSIHTIFLAFRNTTPHFKKIITHQANIVRPLNENKLTQIFVEQLDVQLRKMQISSYSVKNQYSDIFLGTRGIPDFYFHCLEEGNTSLPIFIVEAKRLPAPELINQKEYVKGIKKNGGIERFKIEKHGKGQSRCGMLGFIEKESFDFWHSEINNWILEQIKADSSWSKEELLDYFTYIRSSGLDSGEMTEEFTLLTSKVIKTPPLLLYHFWINCA